MIGASNSLEAMHLAEGSNQMDYHLSILGFYDYLPSQMI
jgi:hypothetical protein